jgi:hypothetical protein
MGLQPSGVHRFGEQPIISSRSDEIMERGAYRGYLVCRGSFELLEKIPGTLG